MVMKTVHSGYAFEFINKEPDIVSAYLVAKRVILGAGYGAEIDWQASRNFDSLNEPDFLREYAWVVLSTGMREFIIRSRFHSLSKCFCNWYSAEAIIQQENACRRRALACFNNHHKIESIIKTAHIIESLGFCPFKEHIRQDPLANLQSLPFIGPITCYHLAKNIGLPLAKPDRHLVRLANSVGYDDVQEFCRVISDRAHDSVPVVDVVLWRFATITETYLKVFLSIALEKQNSLAPV